MLVPWASGTFLHLFVRHCRMSAEGVCVRGLGCNVCREGERKSTRRKPMAETVVKPSGAVHVPHGTQVTIGNNGSVHCKQQVQDYLPPALETVRLWVTANDNVAASRGSAARQLGARPANYATSHTGITPSSLSLPAGDAFGDAVQNGMTVLQLSTDSAGIAGSWGPLAASWTVSVFLRADRPVADFGGYRGCGDMTVLSSPSVGISLPLPSGGSVPAAALSQNGGPLDGVAPGWTWDLPFLNQWRHLCIRNDAATGVRTVFVDGHAATVASASLAAIPADTPLTLLGRCAVTFAELMVWDGAQLTDTEVASLRGPLRRKWGVSDLPRTWCRPVLRGTLALTVHRSHNAGCQATGPCCKPGSGGTIAALRHPGARMLVGCDTRGLRLRGCGRADASTSEPVCPTVEGPERAQPPLRLRPWRRDCNMGHGSGTCGEQPAGGARSGGGAGYIRKFPRGRHHSGQRLHSHGGMACGSHSSRWAPSWLQRHGQLRAGRLVRGNRKRNGRLDHADASGRRRRRCSGGVDPGRKLRLLPLGRGQQRAAGVGR